jgi:hypothetical protein
MIDVNDQGLAISSSFDTAIDSVVQKVKPKVLAEWVSSRVLNNISVVSSVDYSSVQKEEGNVGDFFDVRQVANGWNRQAFTWAVAGDKDIDGLPMRSDGTWHAMPEKNDGSLEFGWRCPTASASSGTYSVAPIVTMTFDQEKINYIEVYTSEFSGAIKEYTLEYKDVNDVFQTVASNHLLSKGTYKYRHPVASGDMVEIKGTRLTVHKTHNGSDHARVTEINPIYETDISEYVINMSYEKNREVHKTTLPLGGISANSFQVSLDNTDHSFTIGTSTAYSRYMAKDVKLTMSLGWRISEFPDIYEYINCGTYWVDEWKIHSDMRVDAQCRDFTRFMSDATISGGFILKDTDAANALRYLLMMKNFPRADVDALFPYQNSVKEDGAVAHYRFSEGAISGDLSSNDSITPASGLLARWWVLDEVSGDETSSTPTPLLRDSVPLRMLGFGGRERVDYTKSPNVVENASTNSASGYVINFTNRDPGGESSYYHTVVDGFFVPPTTDDYSFRTTIEGGGFRLYIGGSSSRYVTRSLSGKEKMRRDLDSYKGELRLDKFFNNDSSTAYETETIRLQGNMPVPIRLEAAHTTGSFALKLERKAGAGAYAAVSPSETTTDIAFDVIGGRDDYVALNDFSSLNRNHGIYSGDPLLRKPGGMNSDPDDLSVDMDSSIGSNDFMTIAYDESIDLTDTMSENYTGTFSIEAFINLSATVAGQGVYVGNLDNGTSGVGTKGVGLFYKSGSHGVKFINDSGTMHEASVASAGPLDEWVHVVATYDGSDLKYYLNGVLKAASVSVGSPALWDGQDFIAGKSTYGASSVNAYTRARFGEFAIYRKALTPNQVRDHYYETAITEIVTYPYLYGEEDVFGAAGKIATGDLGMFYFDEFGKFKYDHYNRLFESVIPEHSVSQATISDRTNIKRAETRIELLANKITVKVNPLVTKNVGITSLWRPKSPSTLTATRVRSGTSVTLSEIAIVYADNTANPPWPKSGYFKIGTEIIKYDDLEVNQFKDLTRGQFGTAASAHAGGDKIREVRRFEFTWSQSPAVDIKEPFIAAIEFESPDLISIDRFIKKPFGGELVLSATEDIPIDSTSNVGDIVYIEGENPYTGLSYYTSISGVSVSTGGSKSEATSQSSVYSESIRKYGIKEIKINNRFIHDEEQAKRLADFLIAKTENGVPILDVDVMSMPKIQLGDRVTVSTLDQLGISNKDYWVVESKITYNGGTDQKLTLREVV